jgi:putative nucleotidyltransferase with HDIG domain
MKELLSQFRKMPAQPDSHKQVLQILEDPDTTNEEIAAKINRDMALTAHVLKMANSAAFAPTSTIHSTVDALALIGTLRLRALVSTAWAFQFIDGKNNIKGFDPKYESEHSLQVGLETQKLASAIQCKPEIAEDAFTAGLVHDLGKFLMAVNVPDAYAKITEEMELQGKPRWQIENEQMGYNHAHIGAAVLQTWGMAKPIVDAVKWHHEPENQWLKEINPLILVHLANCSATGVEPHAECLGRYAVLKMRK